MEVAETRDQCWAVTLDKELMVILLWEELWKDSMPNLVCCLSLVGTCTDFFLVRDSWGTAMSTLRILVVNLLNIRVWIKRVCTFIGDYNDRSRFSRSFCLVNSQCPSLYPLQLVQNKGDRLFPALDSTPTSKQNQHASPAPFNSTQARRHKDISEVADPGPGAYEVDVYRPINTIESSFKSKCQRFNPSIAKTEPTPGPADYNPSSQTRKEKPLKSSMQNPVMKMIFAQNQSRKADSIKKPSHYVRVIFKNPQNKGSYYSKYVDAAFISNKEIGPGEYDLNGSFNKDNGLSWSRSKVQRFQGRKKEEIGPGSYDHSLGKQSRKQSAPFRSQDVRSYFDHVRYKSCNQPYVDLMNKFNIKDSLPGPGQYQLAQGFAQKQSLVQGFGSYSQRFKQSSLSTQEGVGPGAYNFDQKAPKSKPIMSQIVRRKRCKSEQIEKWSQPRPHSYDYSSNTLHDDLYQKFRNGYCGNFGSKQARFKLVDNPSPGPGNYCLQRRDKPISTSSYMANSKRQTTYAPEETPFIDYNVGIYDISRTQEKQKEMIKNLQLVEIRKPGFQSGQARFKYQTPQTVNTIVPPAEPQPNKEKPSRLSAVFNSKSTRVGFGPWGTDTPPPGFYYRQSRLEKSSFNTKYGFKEKNKNK